MLNEFAHYALIGLTVGVVATLVVICIWTIYWNITEMIEWGSK